MSGTKAFDCYSPSKYVCLHVKWVRLVIAHNGHHWLVTKGCLHRSERLPYLALVALSARRPYAMVHHISGEVDYIQSLRKENSQNRCYSRSEV